MRKKLLILPFSLFCMILLMTSCFKDEVETTSTYTVYEPVYISIQEVRNSFSVLPAKTLEKPGKIYIYGKYLLINENKKGIHILDNSNPSAPNNIAFLNIPGNVDMAVKNNVLYADNYNDLISLDISNPANVKLISRSEESFKTYQKTQDGNSIIDYAEKKITVKSKNDYHRSQGLIFTSGVENKSMDASAGSSGGGPSGMGGSMARFTLYENNLYIVDEYRLHLYNISSPGNPVKGQVINIGSGIETIFPHEDKLFIGSQTGMIIYSLSNPASPQELSRYAHISSCDPVVVDGDYAYVTLRSGTMCQGFTNQLEVVDIKNIQSPKLVKTYPMSNPHGLGIASQAGTGLNKPILFLCDGSDGLKVYNIQDPQKISDNRLGHYKDFDAYDVIPYNNILILIGKNGIRQYDYSDPEKLKLLSTIAVLNN